MNDSGIYEILRDKDQGFAREAVGGEANDRGPTSPSSRLVGLLLRPFMLYFFVTTSNAYLIWKIIFLRCESKKGRTGM